jgi:hypothetical protein
MGGTFSPGQEPFRNHQFGFQQQREGQPAYLYGPGGPQSQQDFMSGWGQAPQPYASGSPQQHQYYMTGENFQSPTYATGPRQLYQAGSPSQQIYLTGPAPQSAPLYATGQAQFLPTNQTPQAERGVAPPEAQQGEIDRDFWAFVDGTKDQEERQPDV